MTATNITHLKTNDVLVVCGEAVRVDTFHHTAGGYLAFLMVERLEAPPGDDVKFWCLDLTVGPLSSIADFPTIN